MPQVFFFCVRQWVVVKLHSQLYLVKSAKQSFLSVSANFPSVHVSFRNQNFPWRFIIDLERLRQGQFLNTNKWSISPQTSDPIKSCQVPFCHHTQFYAFQISLITGVLNLRCSPNLSPLRFNEHRNRIACFNKTYSPRFFFCLHFITVPWSLVSQKRLDSNSCFFCWAAFHGFLAS